MVMSTPEEPQAEGKSLALFQSQTRPWGAGPSGKAPWTRPPVGDRRSRVCWGLVEGQPGETGEGLAGLSPWLSCLCSQPGPLCTGASAPREWRRRIAGESSAQRGRPGVGFGVEVGGAQAGGQSERYPHPWEDWEAGAESQPHPLRLRVTPDQDHLSLPIPAQSSLPMRIRLWSHLGVTRDPPSSSPPSPNNSLLILCPEYLVNSSLGLPLPALVWDGLPFPWMAHWLSPLSCPPSPSDCQKHPSNTQT